MFTKTNVNYIFTYRMSRACYYYVIVRRRKKLFELCRDLNLFLYMYIPVKIKTSHDLPLRSGRSRISEKMLKGGGGV
jgi:hypothetical protein